MTRPALRRLLTALAVVLVAACSGSGDDDAGPTSSTTSLPPTTASPPIDEYAPVLETALATLVGSPTAPGCLGADAAEVVGVDRLRAIGAPAVVAGAVGQDLSALGLTPEEAAELAQLTFDCVPGRVDAVRARYVEGVEGDELACVSELLTPDVLVELEGYVLAGADPDSERLDDVGARYQACLAA